MLSGKQILIKGMTSTVLFNGSGFVVVAVVVFVKEKRERGRRKKRKEKRKKKNKNFMRREISQRSCVTEL